MTDAELKVLVRLARDLHLGSSRCRHARPGDLVVEISKFDTDPDAIGWLVAHGRAPYERDAPPGSPTREVWDVAPLSGRTNDAGGPMRWENAEFVALPEAVAELARAAFDLEAERAQRQLRLDLKRALDGWAVWANGDDHPLRPDSITDAEIYDQTEIAELRKRHRL